MTTALRSAAADLARQYSGGLDAMAAALAMGGGGEGLRQRLLGHRGARLDVDHVHDMQLICDSTAIIEAWAHDCGGVFVKLPPAEATRGDLAQALNKCVMRMGQMSADFERAIKDGQIDVRECKVLQADVSDLSAAAREFVGLALAVFGTRDVQQALAVDAGVSAEGS